MSSLRKAFIKDESGNPVWAKAHLSSVYDDNGTPLSTTLSNIESTTYVPTLSIEPSSSTTTYTKDGVTHNFEIGQFARVSNSGSYDFYQLTNLVLENNTPVATWQKVVKSDNAGIVTIPSAPTGTTTSYTKDGETVDFKVGDEVRVADAENAPEGSNGYVYYKLYDLTEDQGTKTAYWNLLGKVSYQGKINVSITVKDALGQIVPSSQIGNIVVTCTLLDDNTSQSITWGGTDITFSNLVPIKDYRISVEEKEGWSPDKKYDDVNISLDEEKNVSFSFSKLEYAYIEFDQTVSDETQMITVSETLNGTKQVLNQETGRHANAALQALRDSSHLYMGKYSNGTMALRQLKDDDGTKYADDNSTANMTGVDGDHYLRINAPFFVKRVSGENSGDVVTYCLAVGGQPEGTGWKQIITSNDLLGVHEATIEGSTTSISDEKGILRSISGGKSTGNFSQYSLKKKVRNGGTGFTLVTWEWHCMMAFLFYAWYGRINAVAQCGNGDERNSSRTLGTKDNLGMTDTDSANGNTDNTKFWGLENWWGGKGEYIDNVSISDYVWTVTNVKDNTSRIAGTASSTNGYIKKMMLSENLDLIPTDTSSGGSATTYYCDKYYCQSGSRVALRACENPNSYGGISFIFAPNDQYEYDHGVGSRLAFNGSITEASVTKLRFRTSNDVAVVGETVTVTTPTGTETHVTDANGEITVMTLPGTCALTCLTHTLNINQFTATAGYHTVAVTATEKPLETGYIILDQTSADPTTKIIDENGHTYSNYTRPAVIDSIRAASHCYVGTFANNKMSLKQLSDRNGTLYADGTSAATDIATTGKDVFMRLPFFFTRVSEYATDKIKIEFAFDAGQTATSTRQPSGNGWKQWGGNDLIGKYEAYETNNMTYSKSGVDSTGNVSQANMKSHARARGTGFTLVKWRHQNIMAILFYAYYGHTDCQTLIGSGAYAYNGTSRTTGLKNSLGMTDTTSSNGNTDNTKFWGIENWWGDKYEWVDNVVVDSGTWTITEDDDTTRTLTAGTHVMTAAGSWVYPSKFYIGDYLDVIAAAGQSGGSDSQGYCDGQYIANQSSRVVARSSYYADAYGGVACVVASYDSSYTSTAYGSRVAYTGPIEIA